MYRFCIYTFFENVHLAETSMFKTSLEKTLSRVKELIPSNHVTFKR